MENDQLEKLEAEIKSLKERVGKLEGIPDGACSLHEKEIELDITWPEADIGGLHFNAQTTRSVFERMEDGNYYSKDILIHSARDTDEGTGNDTLSDYLDSEDVLDAFQEALENAVDCESGLKVERVFLPKENQGVKKYNGVSWWYWLLPRSASSAASFCNCSSTGDSSRTASSVGGVAPGFCVRSTRI